MFFTIISRLPIINTDTTNRKYFKMFIAGAVLYIVLHYYLFSNSKINLSIHPIIYELNNNDSKEEYFSERVPQILGSKGLLMTNSNLSNKLVKGEDYIHIDKNIDYLEKIMEIINNNDKFNIVRESGHKKALLYYQWNNWAETLNKVINQNI